jgi:hypothetical protein
MSIERIYDTFYPSGPYDLIKEAKQEMRKMIKKA